jgi:hypothetical protein
MLPTEYVQTLINECAKKYIPLGINYAPRLFIETGLEPFDNVTRESRIENKRRIMYYYLASRGLDANWVFDNTALSNEDLLNKINEVSSYIASSATGIPAVNPDSIYWLLWLIGDIPIDFSVRTDCNVNWTSVDSLDQFFADVNNEYIWLLPDGNLDFNIMGHLHHPNTQAMFEEYYNLPFSQQQLNRPELSNGNKQIKMPINLSNKKIGTIDSESAIQQRITLDDCVDKVINGLKSSGKYDAAVKELGSAEAVKQTVKLACMKQLGMAKESEESKTPWGWIIGGVAVLALGGTAIWYFSSNKSSR